MATGDFYWETTGGIPAPPEPAQWQDFSNGGEWQKPAQWQDFSNGGEWQKYYKNDFNFDKSNNIDNKITINGNWYNDTEVEDLKKRLNICEKFIQMLVTMLKGTDFENDKNWKDIENIANKLNLAPITFSFTMDNGTIQWPDYEPPKKEKEEEKEEEPLLEDELFEIKM